MSTPDLTDLQRLCGLDADMNRDVTWDVHSLKFGKSVMKERSDEWLFPTICPCKCATDKREKQAILIHSMILYDTEHQRADWTSIHEKICQLLIPVRTPVPFLNSAAERSHSMEQLLQRKKHLIELTTKEAQRLLYEGRHMDVIPAATHSLSFSVDVYGLASVELVPVYLILAEANIGLGHLTQAEEYLSHAYWTVMKATDCSNSIRSKLHRNLGLLYSAKGEFEESLRHLSNDVYFASTVSGPSHMTTSGGFFHMANIFFRQNKMDIADSLYSEVTDIWHAHLSKLVEVQIQASLRSGPAWFDDVDQEYLDENQEAEALQILSAIYDIREQVLKESTKMAKVLHTLTMLYFLSRDFHKASEWGKKLLQISEQLPQDDQSDSITVLMENIERKLNTKEDTIHKTLNTIII